MNKLLIMAISAIGPIANAAERAEVVEAPVVEVEPIVQIVTRKIPHEICHEERVKVLQAGNPHSATPDLLGAVIGGTVGGLVGEDSRHQPIIAGAGALLGASIGHDISHQRYARSYYTTEQHCGIDYELRDSERVVGYRVGYLYGDTIYYTRTDTAPGDTIRVRVELTPLS